MGKQVRKMGLLLVCGAMCALLLVSCAKRMHTDNKRPEKHKYRGAGRAW